MLLTAWWTALAWRDLGALRLPEARDMLQLAQIRDWADGQGFADLTQSRLGPPEGVAMSGTRLADLVPGAAIRLLSPLIGPRRAEIAAVVFWPELLFFLHLLLAGALAQRLGGQGSAAPAVALAALAFPAVALLMPGRIAPQGLQLVLVEASVLGLLDRRLLLAGVAGGVALLTGAEPLPALLGAMIWLLAAWTSNRSAAAPFGVGLLAAALAGATLLRPQMWPADRCDGVSPPLLVMLAITGGYWLLLDMLSPRLPDRRWRVGAALAVAALAVAAIWFSAPSCMTGWGELAEQPTGAWPQALAYLGLPTIALLVGGSLAHRKEPPSIWLFLAVIAASLLAAWMRLESAVFAAAMAPPLLAQWVLRLRSRGWAVLSIAWLLSAGLAWQALARAVQPRDIEGTANCASREALAALDRLDTGTFAAPRELGAYLVGRTQHRSLAGGGGRNARGNEAVAALFRATPDEARVQANLWTVDYIALCPTASGGLPQPLLRPEGLAAHLLNGATPDWLEPVSLLGSGLSVWRVRAVAGPGLRP